MTCHPMDFRNDPLNTAKKKISLRNRMTFLLIINCFIVFSCSKDDHSPNNTPHRFDLDTITFQHAMKGYEIYSWPKGSDWNYSILIGTNRLKTYQEVISNQVMVLGKDSLKMLLDKMPEGEYLFWAGKGWLASSWVTGYEDLSLPDSNTINEIKAYCIQKKLVLLVSD